ncbi:MAG: hypothetical protein LAT64_07400 [Phycisphaerales bacterium]|nr:hypothetical protein [Planctomycetota bacterium]MCH8508582.1 hypothetical protein [Phycisphaerales bacterium]
MQNAVSLILPVVAIVTITLPSHAETLAHSVISAGTASPYLDPAGPVTLRLVQTDFVFFQGSLIQIPVSNPVTYLDWTFSQADLGAQLTLDPGSPSWDALVGVLTNGLPDAFSVQHSVIFSDPDAPASGLGWDYASLDADLLGLPTDLVGAAIDRIEFQLTRFDVYDGQDGVAGFEYDIELSVYGTVPAPATLALLAPLLLRRRRR